MSLSVAVPACASAMLGINKHLDLGLGTLIGACDYFGVTETQQIRGNAAAVSGQALQRPAPLVVVEREAV